MFNKAFLESALEENIISCISRLSKAEKKEIGAMLKELPERKKDRLRYLIKNGQSNSIA